MNRYDAVLIQMLQTCEKERAILFDWPSKIEAGLATRKEWIEVRRLAAECWVCGDVVISKVEETTAVKTITARPRHDIDGTHAG
ncbi:MAG: hypothetical protein ABI995_13215 [Acidobacteriota bacterium]